MEKNNLDWPADFGVSPAILHDIYLSNVVCYQRIPQEYLERCNHRFSNVSKSYQADNFAGFAIFSLTIDHVPVTIFAFQGTTSMQDWDTNLKFWPRLTDSGLMHSGFDVRADNFPLEYAVELMAKDPHLKVIFTGHSQGGAVSAILTTKLLLYCSATGNGQFHSRVLCITIGAPLFGTAAWARMIESSQLKNRFLHFVDECDPVPRILSMVYNRLQTLLATDRSTTATGNKSLWDMLSSIYCLVASKETGAVSELTSTVIEKIMNMFRVQIREALRVVEYKAAGTFVLVKNSEEFFSVPSSQIQDLLGLYDENLSLTFGISHKLENYHSKFFRLFEPKYPFDAGELRAFPNLNPSVTGVSFKIFRDRQVGCIQVHGENLSLVMEIRVPGFQSVNSSIFYSIKPGNRSQHQISFESKLLQQEEGDRLQSVQVECKTPFMREPLRFNAVPVKYPRHKEQHFVSNKTPGALVEHASILILLMAPSCRGLKSTQVLVNTLSEFTKALPIEALYMFLVEKEKSFADLCSSEIDRSQRTDSKSNFYSWPGNPEEKHRCLGKKC